MKNNTIKEKYIGLIVWMLKRMKKESIYQVYKFTQFKIFEEQRAKRRKKKREH